MFFLPNVLPPIINVLPNTEIVYLEMGFLLKTPFLLSVLFTGFLWLWKRLASFTNKFWQVIPVVNIRYIEIIFRSVVRWSQIQDTELWANGIYQYCRWGCRPENRRERPKRWCYHRTRPLEYVGSRHIRVWSGWAAGIAGSRYIALHQLSLWVHGVSFPFL